MLGALRQVFGDGLPGADGDSLTEEEHRTLSKAVNYAYSDGAMTGVSEVSIAYAALKRLAPKPAAKDPVEEVLAEMRSRRCAIESHRIGELLNEFADRIEAALARKGG
jgi:hypothetical protein